MPGEAMELIHTLGSVSAQDAWERILDLFALECLRAPFRLYGELLEGKDVAKVLLKKKHFEIESDGWSFQFVPITNYRHSLMKLKAAVKPDHDVWDKLAIELSFDAMISSRIYDVDYEHWQNAEDPLEFNVEGRSYEHLPMKSNELPYPLEQKVIDISNNPGRRVLRQGYVEAVGSTMWLSRRFMELTGANLNSLSNSSWCAAREVGAGILRIQVGTECFTTEMSDQGDLQRKLRSALFPIS